ncbi:MAG TPA: hypothetical protein PKJ28_09255 [Bacteroidales bacterium]|nr:hypothetical protein [Bacteroidales bacterium]HPS74618.1 hypothetical protein [Bacteroidales bacterium]
MTLFRKFVIKICCFLILFAGLDYLLSSLAMTGLEKYFGLDRPADILCIGHSHTVLGIDKSLLEKHTGKRIAVYAREGAGIKDRAVMLDQYFRRFPKSRPIILYDVNPRLLNATGLSEHSYTLFYPFFDEPEVASYIRESNPDPSSLLFRKFIRLCRYNDVTLRFSLRGWFDNRENLKTNRITEEVIGRVIRDSIYSDICPDQGCVSVFDRTLARCRRQGCTVVLLNIPTIDVIRTNQRIKDQVLRRFQSVAAKDNRIIYLDYNPAFSSRHKLFSDPLHLNREGQRIFTEQLAKELDSVYFGPAAYQ